MSIIMLHFLALDSGPLPLPLLGRRVPAGFPSPADDYLEGEHRNVVLHKQLAKKGQGGFHGRWQMPNFLFQRLGSIGTVGIE